MVDWSLGTVGPKGRRSDPSVKDEMAAPIFYMLHDETCRNMTYRRQRSEERSLCGRHVWKRDLGGLIVCTKPSGHEGDCP